MADFSKILEQIKKKWMNKKNLSAIAVLSLGILLLSISKKPANLMDDAIVEETEDVFIEGYEESLENKLIRSLSKVQGVGEVDVLITLSYGKEIIIAEEENTSTQLTKEKTKDGSSRDITNETLDNKKVFLQKPNGNEPLVLKEIKPKIEGILIVAQGGDNPQIRNHLTQAAMSLLNVEAHKVTVLKMK